jgi:hypothetical protein
MTDPIWKVTFSSVLKRTLAADADYTVDIDELKIITDWAYVRFRFAWNGPSGYSLDILRKHADGRWLFTRTAIVFAPA